MSFIYVMSRSVINFSGDCEDVEIHCDKFKHTGIRNFNMHEGWSCILKERKPEAEVFNENADADGAGFHAY